MPTWGNIMRGLSNTERERTSTQLGFAEREQRLQELMSQNAAEERVLQRVMEDGRRMQELEQWEQAQQEAARRQQREHEQRVQEQREYEQAEKAYRKKCKDEEEEEERRRVERLRMKEAEHARQQEELLAARRTIEELEAHKVKIEEEKRSSVQQLEDRDDQISKLHYKLADIVTGFEERGAEIQRLRDELEASKATPAEEELQQTLAERTAERDKCLDDYAAASRRQQDLQAQVQDMDTERLNLRKQVIARENALKIEGLDYEELQRYLDAKDLVREQAARIQQLETANARLRVRYEQLEEKNNTIIDVAQDNANECDQARAETREARVRLIEVLGREDERLAEFGRTIAKQRAEFAVEITELQEDTAEEGEGSGD